MEKIMSITIWVLLFILGSCIYSFLNVIIYRAPKKMNFIKGRSICPACGHTLKAWDLVPILSYMALRGKCRYCKEKIGVRDTLIEIAGGVIAVICAWHFQDAPIEGVIVFAFISILTVVTWTDIDTMEIPDGCHIAIAVLAVISFIISTAILHGVNEYTVTGVKLASRIIGMLCISMPMLIMALALPGAFGGGDIKLMMAGGLFLGWKLTVVAAVLALLTGGLWGILLLITKKKGRKEHFAFGPFLCAGMALAIFFGEALVRWYMGFLQF